MMCSKLLHHETKHGVVYRGIDRFLDGLTRGYMRSLDWVLAHRWTVFAGWLLVVAAGGWLFKLIRQSWRRSKTAA